VTGLGIAELKDLLWAELNKESNRIETTSAMAHRSKDVTRLQQELEDEGEDEDFEYEYIDEEDEDEIEEYWDDEYDGEEDRK
jgi:GTP-binding protein